RARFVLASPLCLTPGPPLRVAEGGTKVRDRRAMTQPDLVTDRRIAQAHGFTLWFTGLSGAGKSTLATAVSAELRGLGMAVEVLDGEDRKSTRLNSSHVAISYAV